MQSKLLLILISIFASGAQAGGIIPFGFFPLTNTGACTVPNPTAFTWIGGTNADWNNNANWFGGIAPGPSDVALFDANCTLNCSPTINVAINVAGIDMKCSYTGTISQGVGNTITVGASGWLQRGGSFLGSASAITLAGALRVTGGIFNSTSGSLTTTFNSGVNTLVDMFIIRSPGSFVHRNGTVVLNGVAVTCGNIQPRSYSISVPATSPLYNLTFAGVTDICHGTEPWHHVDGTTLTVINTLLHQNGRLFSTTENNQILLSGDLDIAATADGAFGQYGAKIVFNGIAAQEYSYVSPGHSAILVIDKTGGSVTPALGTNDLMASRFVLTQGSFTAPTGTMNLSDLEPGVNNSAFDIFKVANGSTFNVNGTSVVLNGYPQWCGNFSLRIYNIDVPAGFSFQNLEINAGVDVCHESIATHRVQGAGFNVDGLFTVTNGYLDGPGVVTALGDVTIAATSDRGTAALTFSGTAAQTYTVNGPHMTGNVIVNKASGTVTMARNVSLSTAGQNLTIASGVLDMYGSDLAVNNVLTIGAGATLICNSGVVSHGTLSNAGTLDCAAGTHVFTSIGAFATSQAKSAAATLAFTPTVQINAGNMGVLVVVTDNLGTVTGSTNEHTTITDTAGNIWKKKIEYSNTQGAIADGSTVSIWTVRALVNLTITDTVTVNFSGSPTARTATGWQYSYTGPHGFSVDGSMTSADVNIDPSSMTNNGLASRPYLWIRATGVEGDGTAYTESTNYTAFTHTSSTSSGGSGVTNIGARGEFRIFTGTGDTTDPTGTAADNANDYISIP